VAIVRRASDLKRVGHAGTLDPLATGVLLVCLGAATRVSEFLMNSRKVYRASVRLGVTTDTDDAEGRMLREAAVATFDRTAIGETLGHFVGSIEQVPPMRSALKREGQRLYKLARLGATIEREPRTIEIYRLDLLGWNPPLIEFEVECSKGTYIRALARDIGEKLGCGAHLAALTRLASGRFTLDQAKSLEAVQDAFAHGQWSEIVHPLDEALLDFDALVADAEQTRRIKQGIAIPAASPPGTMLVRAYSADGECIALLRYNSVTHEWWPEKVFSQ
jgi:tRNA pseudouridine55 synthase